MAKSKLKPKPRRVRAWATAASVPSTGTYIGAGVGLLSLTVGGWMLIKRRNRGN